MSAWPLKRLAELGAVSTGSTPRTAEPRFYGGDLPFVTPSELDTGLPITTTPRTLTDEGAAEARVLPEGAVMVCCIGSLGKIGIAGRSVATNQQINSVVFDRDKVWPSFGFYACRLLKPKLDCMAPATTLPIVSKSKFADLTIPVPPLAEQRRIAEVLDRAEALRAKRRAALAQLDSLTQSLFLDLFGDPMKNGRGWTLLKVGVAGRVQLGRQRAPQYQSGKHTRPYVRVANVYEDRLALSDVLSMDFDQDDFAAYRLEHGDILLNEGQSTELVGRTAMWRNELPDCCFQNTLIRFQPNRETTLPEFALALFLHYYRSGEFAKISSKTSNVAHLGAGRFAAMPFPLPPIPLQREFARRVTAVEALKTAQRASLAELDALFATLQHRAFRGEL